MKSFSVSFRSFFPILSVAILVLVFCGTTRGQDPEADDDAAAPFAQTTEEKTALLDRAEAAMTWFRSLDRTKRADLASTTYRERIHPLELMQAAAILKEKKSVDMSRMLREMLPYFDVTPEECFIIEERLGDETLDSFTEETEIVAGESTLDSATRIRQGAARFLADELRPSERMALLHPPESAMEIMKAVDFLAVSGRPALVRYYLRRFLLLEADPEDCAKIAQSLGSARLRMIAGNPHFAPQGDEAITFIYAQARKHWTDADEISGHLDAWDGMDDDGKLSPESRAALRGLWRGERYSVAQLLEKLGETTDGKTADELIAVILSFGGDVREALAVSLSGDDETLRNNAARGLVASAPPQDAFLFFPLIYDDATDLPDELRKNIETRIRQSAGRLPTAEEAAATLYHRAKDYYERSRTLKTGPDGYVRFWNWDAGEGKPRYIRMLLPSAYRLFALRYAGQAYRLQPDDPTIHRLYLAALFDRAVHLGGLDGPVDWQKTGVADALEETTPERLRQVLQDGIDSQHYAVAQAAAQALGERGEASELLASQNGRPGPLVQALDCPDRRVRFAALEAIMTLKPEKSFAGSSYVTETLAWFSRADGAAVLVSAHPKTSEAARTFGYFIEQGFRGELATTSGEAMRKAAETPDVEMLVIDDRCMEPSVASLVTEMRNDPRTHDIPIAVLTDKERVLDAATIDRPFDAMQKVDRQSPDNPFATSLSVTYPRVFDDVTARWIREDLFEKTSARPVKREVRLEQARKALSWIKEIYEAQAEGPTIYRFEEIDDVIGHALRSSHRVLWGLELAAVVKSVRAQQALFTIAADAAGSMELREKAEEAFAKSVETHGVLLRGKQVQAIYDRYNATVLEPEESQKLLGRLIDIVENKVLESEQVSE